MAIKVPNSKKEITIQDMVVGQVGYVVPWAFTFNSNDELFVNKSYGVFAQPGGTVNVEIGMTPYGLYINMSTLKDELSKSWSIDKCLPIEFDGKPSIWQLAEIALKKRDYAVMKSLFSNP